MNKIAIVIYCAAASFSAAATPSAHDSTRNFKRQIQGVDIGKIIEEAPKSASATPELPAQKYFTAAAGRTLIHRSLVWRNGGQEITLDKVIFAADGSSANVYVCHSESKYQSNPPCSPPIKITPGSPQGTGVKTGGSWNYESKYTSSIRVDADSISFSRNFSKNGEWQGERSISTGIGYFPLVKVEQGVNQINDDTVFVMLTMY